MRGMWVASDFSLKYNWAMWGVFFSWIHMLLALCPTGLFQCQVSAVTWTNCACRVCKGSAKRATELVGSRQDKLWIFSGVGLGCRKIILSHYCTIGRVNCRIFVIHFFVQRCTLQSWVLVRALLFSTQQSLSLRNTDLTSVMKEQWTRVSFYTPKHMCTTLNCSNRWMQQLDGLYPLWYFFWMWHC
jgi:hypothetical protein